MGLPMKSILFRIVIFFVVAGITDFAIQPVGAQEHSGQPLFSLSVQGEPLGNALMIVTNQTGVQFSLNEEWETHPVSVDFSNLPLDKGLNRLLKSLNYTIVWESESSATIMVYGEAEPEKNDGISFGAPPHPEPPPVEPPEMEPDQEREEDLEPAEGDDSETAPEASGNEGRPGEEQTSK
jgi:hypothetical protein